jgi:hypothetical protein
MMPTDVENDTNMELDHTPTTYNYGEGNCPVCPIVKEMERPGVYEVRTSNYLGNLDKKEEYDGAAEAFQYLRIYFMMTDCKIDLSSDQSTYHLTKLYYQVH